MLYKAAYLVVAALSALTVVAGPVQERNTHITTLKPPQLIPFAHIALKVEDSTYVNETNGIQTGQANNQGGKSQVTSLRPHIFKRIEKSNIEPKGNITGAITGKVLKLGTEFETFPTAANLSESVSQSHVYTSPSTCSNGTFGYRPTTIASQSTPPTA